MQEIPEFYLAPSPGERTSLRGDEVIDMQLQVHPPGASFMLGNTVKSFSDDMLASVGLMRLHSAPSSMLANPVDTAGDDFVSTGSSPLAAQTAVDAEFARLFPDDIACPAARFESEGLFPLSAKSGALSNGGGGVESAGDAEQRLAGDRSRLISQHSLFNRAATNGIVDDAGRVTFPAILEQRAEVSSENFYGNSQIPVSVCRQQGARAVVSCLVSGSDMPCYSSLPESETNLVRHRSSPAGLVSGSGMPCYSSLPESESNLVRHRSSPAGLVSRLATEAQTEVSETPNASFASSMNRPPSDCRPERATMTRATASVSPVPMGSSFESGQGPGMNSNDLGVSSSNKSGLLRHSSSPAGLLSQLNLDGLVDAEKLMLFSSSGNSSEEGSFDKSGGLPFVPNFPWDESVAAPGRITDESPNGSSSAARKRIREIKYFAGSTSTDPRHGDALEHGASANYFSLPTAFTPETPFCPDKLPPDSVLCRARAKRGCATHPRSIAERVRRTKISERMRKLQELVPNMDKQTNTADMLDEAVEYVKLLQQQIQELTEKRPKCDGSCKQKTPSSK